MNAGAGPLRVLVVDDEPAIRRFLRAGLSNQGYVITEVEAGLPALDVVRRQGTDLMVLDLGLPDIDGIEVIGRTRAAGCSVPIIVLSSRNDEAAKVDALDLGADDYVTKPFGIEELLARIRTAQRHRLQREGEAAIFRSGDLTIDLVRRIVTVRGVEVKFSPREYGVLRLLAQHAGKVLTHRMILKRFGAWIRTYNTCASTSGRCVRRSRPIQNGRSISRPRPAWATACGSAIRSPERNGHR
jgi:two-component system KDP operon response regulator KdpE